MALAECSVVSAPAVSRHEASLLGVSGETDHLNGSPLSSSAHSVASSVASAKGTIAGRTRRRSKIEQFNDNVNKKIRGIFSHVDWDQVNHYMDRLS